jgi:isocitrate lyase
MIKETFEVSGVIPPRTRYEVLSSLMEEVGELATEVAIAEGYSRKSEGKDAIIGEAVDVIVCALDMIWVDWKNADQVDLEKLVMTILKSKLAKWKEKKS